ncbi:hypothetical protein HDU67_009600 [Dinochytrium kinnereticum]|nr:hypothetical protein HDU67_009600 [Dinochytrium kinnereticum]
MPASSTPSPPCDPFKFSRFVWSLVNFLLDLPSSTYSSATLPSSCSRSCASSNTTPPSSPLTPHSTFTSDRFTFQQIPTSPFPSTDHSHHLTSYHRDHGPCCIKTITIKDAQDMKAEGIETIHHALSSSCAASAGVSLPIIMNALLLIDRYALALHRRSRYPSRRVWERLPFKEMRACTGAGALPILDSSACHHHQQPPAVGLSLLMPSFEHHSHKRTRSAPAHNPSSGLQLPQSFDYPATFTASCQCCSPNAYQPDRLTPEHVFVAALMISTKMACDAAPGARLWAKAAKLTSSAKSNPTSNATNDSTPSKKRRSPLDKVTTCHLDLVTLEREILSTIQHKVTTTDSELEQFGEAVRALASRSDGSSSPSVSRSPSTTYMDKSPPPSRPVIASHVLPANYPYDWIQVWLTTNYFSGVARRDAVDRESSGHALHSSLSEPALSTSYSQCVNGYASSYGRWNGSAVDKSELPSLVIRPGVSNQDGWPLTPGGSPMGFDRV